MTRFFSRRQFTAATATAVLASVAPAASRLAANPVCVFTKPFQSLSYDELGARIAALGITGIEAPIRDGGHIEPADVEVELPKMVAALKKHNVEITVLTSSINDPDDPLTETILRTAAAEGIRFYRMKYFKYAQDTPIANQLGNWRGQIRDLAAMNSDIGITAVYQNHAGRHYLGAAIWDLQRVLTGINPAHVGVAYDIRHATVEGGTSWPTTFRMIRPHVRVVYVKDFQWGKDQPQNVPLGEGRVDRSFFNMLADSRFDGPISLHEEYLDHRKPELVQQHLDAIRRDLDTLKKWM